MSIKPKKRGFGLEMKIFEGNDEESYLVLKTKSGSYHVFQEVEAKQAARECGALKESNSRQMWNEVWITFHAMAKNNHR